MYLSETDHAFLAVQVSRYQSDVASVLVMNITSSCFRLEKCLV